MMEALSGDDWGEQTWRRNTAVGRWYGLGAVVRPCFHHSLPATLF